MTNSIGKADMNYRFAYRIEEKTATLPGETFDTDRFDYNATRKQCLIYGKTTLETCEFTVEINKITETIPIDSAKAYVFHVQLIAPDLEVKTNLGNSGTITHKIPMKSIEKTLECSTRPKKIQGKLLAITIQYMAFANSKWQTANP